MPFKKKSYVSESPLPSLLDALIPLTEEQFASLMDVAQQARKLKASMDALRAGL